MINQIKLKNFGPLSQVAWDRLGPINLIIGKNGTGKTFILKALYSCMRTIEEYRRGNDQRSISDILVEKLYWTFQPDKIGDLVSKGENDSLSFNLILDGDQFSYSFGKDTNKQILSISNKTQKRLSNSIFLPAKEVLSLHSIILKSRDQDKVFGFDDTYFDLAKALRMPPTKGKNYSDFAKSRQSLETILGGRVEYDESGNRWQFRRGNQKFPIGVTAEGIKKIAILDTLLGNRYLDPSSIIFIDEPESALHPSAISQLMDIISILAKLGIQFFLASHSYFVVKKLYLIAQESGISIPVISFDDNTWASSNLKTEIPNNSIISESIKLYEEEMELTLK